MSQYFENDSEVKSNIREIKFDFSSFPFVFLSDNGVFSKNKIDYGSFLLINEYLKEKNNKIKLLDVGCGYGTIGIIISKITGSKVDMIDINKRSIHLTKMNIKKNKLEDLCCCFESDAYKNVTSKYDVIITNPPIRAGKIKVLEILNEAKNHLNKTGELWFVIRKNQGALTIKNILEENYKIEIINKIKGYYVFKAKKC